jgi:hypothetical protein
MQSPRLATVGRSGDLLCSQFMVVLDVAIVNVALSQMRGQPRAVYSERAVRQVLITYGGLRRVSRVRHGFRM